MIFLEREELRALMQAAHDRNKHHHLALVVSLFSGLRVSELLAIRGRDVANGQLAVKRLKKSRATLHAVRIDADPLFDASPLLKLASDCPDILIFPWCRQRVDQFIKRYAELAGLHPSKAHHHVLKHTICMLLWKETGDLSAIQDYVGHKSSSSTLVYMRHDAEKKAHAAVAGLSL